MDKTTSTDPEKQSGQPPIHPAQSPAASPGSSQLAQPALTRIEKAALSFIAITLLGFAIWGGFSLKQKNFHTGTANSPDLPVSGQYATITGFTSHWEKVNDATGVKFGVVVVPTASITLGKNSSSGALRVYFRNADNEHMGDPVTMDFRDGKFASGAATIHIKASDGYSNMMQFHSYQLEHHEPWTIEVLEAETRNTTSSGFRSLIRTPLSPFLR